MRLLDKKKNNQNNNKWLFNITTQYFFLQFVWKNILMLYNDREIAIISSILDPLLNNVFLLLEFYIPFTGR